MTYIKARELSNKALLPLCEGKFLCEKPGTVTLYITGAVPSKFSAIL
jgi:hypothetical protein